VLSADANPLTSPQAAQNGCGSLLSFILSLFQEVKGNPALPSYAVVVLCRFKRSVGLSTRMSQLEGNPACLSEASAEHKFTGRAGEAEKSATRTEICLVGLLYPRCWNHMTVVLDRGSKTCLLSGLRNKNRAQGK